MNGHSYLRTLVLVAATAVFAFCLGLGVAWADGVTESAALPYAKGSCVLNGGALATCTASVPPSCVAPLCAYVSSSLPHAVACAVVGSTLTAVSVTTLDTGTVAFICP